MSKPVYSALSIVRRLFGIFLLLGSTVSAGMVLSNLFISRTSAAELASIAAGLAVGYSVLLLLIGAFSYYRLTRLFSFSSMESTEDRDVRLWLGLTGFPWELCGCFLLCGMAVTQLYHIAVSGLPPWQTEGTAEYIKSTAFELTTFTAFSILHYLAARWMLRPYVRSLQVYRQAAARYGSSVWMMIAILALGTLYVLLRMVWYAYSGALHGSHLRLSVLLGLGGAVLIVTVTAVGLTARYLLRDIERMGTLLRGLSVKDRRGLHNKIPIASPYEAGELECAFNSLQDRFKSEYLRLNQELTLASKVREQLQPQGEANMQGWRVIGVRAGDTEAGEGFYDRIEGSGTFVAWVSGYVTGGGMPVALIMSALLMLVRTGITRREESGFSGSLLEEIHNKLAPIMPEGIAVHVGLCVWESRSDTLFLELAGDMELLMGDRSYTSNLEPLAGRNGGTVTAAAPKRIRLDGESSVTLRAVNRKALHEPAESTEYFSSVKAVRSNGGGSHGLVE